MDTARVCPEWRCCRRMNCRPAWRRKTGHVNRRFAAMPMGAPRMRKATGRYRPLVGRRERGSRAWLGGLRWATPSQIRVLSDTRVLQRPSGACMSDGWLSASGAASVDRHHRASSRLPHFSWLRADLRSRFWARCSLAASLRMTAARTCLRLTNSAHAKPRHARRLHRLRLGGPSGALNGPLASLRL